MKILLDTVIFLRYITDHSKLAPFIKEIIKNKDNEIYLSSVSTWELIIKNQIGKIYFPKPVSDYLVKKREMHEILSLPLDEQSVSKLSNLPAIHKDPFDRILICQAIQNDLTIATTDEIFKEYPVKLL